MAGRYGRRPAARMCCSWCWTIRGLGSSAATAVRSRRRTSTRWPPAGCGSRTCTPRRCARRAVPASSPGVTITPMRWPRSPNGDRLPGLQREHPVRERLAVGDAAASRATARTWSASGTSPRAITRPRRGPSPLAAGSRVRALLRLPRAATPASGIRTSCTTITRSSRRAPRSRATTSPRTWRPGDRVHRRRQADRPGQAVLPAFLLRGRPRATPCAEGVGRQVCGCFRRGLGRLPGEGLRPAEGTRHHARRRGAVPARPRRTGLGVAITRGAQAVQPDDGGVRGLPHHTDHHLGRLLDFLREQASSTTRS